MMRRVVVTGMAGITSLGDTWGKVEPKLRQGKNAVRYMPEWDHVQALNSRLGAPVDDFQTPSHYPRKLVRSMGRVSLMALRAAELALDQAGLLGNPLIQDGRMGISYGSSAGSVGPIPAFGRLLEHGDMLGVTSTSYIQMMAHTAAVNIGLFFGLKGRVITTSSACTSGSQGIGYAYEAIKWGRLPLMLVGGADEISELSVAVFDTLFATSSRNHEPHLTPRPFDAHRDGLVIGEGAGTLILEDLDHALARGALPLAEVLGFGSTSDGAHVTQPEAETMARAMQLALADAKLPVSAIGFVSAHGTATGRGDIAESNATHRVFGANTPISSMKSYLGHTLGACGAIEAWWAIQMMRQSWFAPTLNLQDPDPACAALDYLQGAGRNIDTEHVMCNNFAFGGINTSLIFKKFQ